MERDKSDQTTNDADHALARPTGSFGDVAPAGLVESPSSGKADLHASEVYYCPPRLTIAHLLAWTMLAAIWMKVIMVYEAAGATPPGSDAWVGLCTKVAMYSAAILASAGVLGTVVLLCDSLRGAGGRLQPGHWLVTILSIDFFLQMLAALSQLVLTGSFWGTSRSGSIPCAASWLLARMAIEGTVAVAFLWLAIRMREGMLWRFVAVTLALVSIADAMYYLAYALASSEPLYYRCIQLLFALVAVVSLGALVVLSVAVLVDLARHRRRDGLHWLGVLFAASSCVSHVLHLVAYLIICLIHARYT